MFIHGNVLKSRIQNNSFYTDFSSPHIHTAILTHMSCYAHTVCLTTQPTDRQRDRDLVLVLPVLSQVSSQVDTKLRQSVFKIP